MKALSSAESTYSAFSCNSTQLLRYIEEFSKTQYQNQLFEKQEEEKLEILKYKERLANKEGEAARLTEELHFWKTRAEEAQATIDVVKAELQREKALAISIVENSKSCAITIAEAEINVLKENINELILEITGLKVELKKLKELEAEDTPMVIREEIEKITEGFSNLEKDIVSVGNTQIVKLIV